jgi:hypothetical protein
VLSLDGERSSRCVRAGEVGVGGAGDDHGRPAEGASGGGDHLWRTGSPAGGDGGYGAGHLDLRGWWRDSSAADGGGGELGWQRRAGGGKLGRRGCAERQPQEEELGRRKNTLCGRVGKK